MIVLSLTQLQKNAYVDDPTYKPCAACAFIDALLAKRHTTPWGSNVDDVILRRVRCARFSVGQHKSHDKKEVLVVQVFHVSGVYLTNFASESNQMLLYRQKYFNLPTSVVRCVRILSVCYILLCCN